MLSHSFSIFQKDAVPCGQEKEPVPNSIQMSAVTFRERLYALRKLVLELAQGHIEDYFVTQFKNSYPNYKTQAGLTVRSSADMLQAYSCEENGPSNKMREMVYYCMNGMWDGNAWAAVIESKIMTFLHLRYTTRLGSCSAKVTNPDGMFIHDI
jgi:hypothetical protein